MKSIPAAALLLGSAALAAPAGMPASPDLTANGPVQANQIPPLVPACAIGFNYSVVEQFGDQAHLRFKCLTADIFCQGRILGIVQRSGAKFRFVYECRVVPVRACAVGFSRGDTSPATRVPACLTPMLSCPSKFVPSEKVNVIGTGRHTIQFEYQCYRPA